MSDDLQRDGHVEVEPIADTRAMVLSPRDVVWARRKAAARVAVSRVRRDRLAMTGLVVLVLFALMALFAPLLVPRSALSAVASIDNPTWAPPSREFWCGTDHL